MDEELHYYVTLHGDFKLPEGIGEPTGEELASILVAGLPGHGISILKNEGVDFYYSVECGSDDSTIELMVSAVSHDDPNSRWCIQPCPKYRFFERDTTPDSAYRTLLLAVNEVLQACPRTSEIRWFPSFEHPEHLALFPLAETPIRSPDYANNLHPLIKFDWQWNKITGAIIGPIGFAGFTAFTLSVVAAFPNVGPRIVAIVFFTFIGLMLVVPFTLSILMSRSAKRACKEHQ